ncbi:MAG: hypothetical protein R3A12_19590 [Ignavibacteria bacterium]
MADAFYGGDSKKHSGILISIDQYVGGIRGRKLRGLLNFPFCWLHRNTYFKIWFSSFIFIYEPGRAKMVSEKVSASFAWRMPEIFVPMLPTSVYRSVYKLMQ